MQGWQHSGFSVWVGDQIAANDVERKLFLARYLSKCPVSLNRIEIIEDTLKPTVRYYKDNTKTEYKDFSPLHFIAELTQHIPNKYEQTLRFYGAYSARSRGKAKQQRKIKAWIDNGFEPLEMPEITKPVSRQWSIWIKKVYEIDPLRCPKCGETMKVKSFIFDSRKISKICKSIGVSDYRAPPPIKLQGRRIVNVD